MIQSIEDYLSKLKKELSGCDRATIQDALADAEEYLRTAFNSTVSDDPTISESEALSHIIEMYGMPEEVAVAYRDIEHHLTPAFVQHPRSDEPEAKQKPETNQPFIKSFFGVFADPAAWAAFLYLIFSLVTGIFYFTWAVTGISLSAGLIVLIIGLPFTGLFILSIRGIGLVEGRIVEALLGIRMPRRQQYSRGNRGLWIRFKNIILDKYTWFSIVYMILQLPLGITYFTVLIILVSVSLAGITLPFLQTIYRTYIIISDTHYYLNGWWLVLYVIGGILLLTLTMHLAKYTGRMHGLLAKTLLVRS